MIPFLEILLALPFVLAAIVALSQNYSRKVQLWLTLSAPILALSILLWLTPAVLSGYILRGDHPWLPQIGLHFSLRLDGLAWMFTGLVLLIGVLVIIYAHYYLGAKEKTSKFYSYLLMFMGAMLGVVLSGNLLLLIVFWELTSITSFLLIGFWTFREDAREGAQMALAITSLGGMALLAGVLLIGRIVGSFELDIVLASGDIIRESALYPWALTLILLGIFTKSAQFPFHFWLPHAMAAPTPVSAYLHSATMVKAGVFLLARLHPALAGTDLFFYLVSGIGAITLVWGAWQAIFQHDLKGILAYSTLSHLGLITLLFGLSTPMAVVAGIFHIINHATFKASLFMAAGIIDHETGTRDIRRLGNLRQSMPYTSALAITASLAMAGIPLLNGFLSKEMFLTEALDVHGTDLMGVSITLAALAASILGVAYSLRFVIESFFGRGPRALEEVPHEPPRWIKIPVEILVVICVIVGIFPAFTVAPILYAAAHSILGTNMPQYSLSIWHGWNWPLAISFIGVIGGIALYFGLRRLLDLNAIVKQSIGRHLFRFNFNTLYAVAQKITHLIVNGSLQRSLFWLIICAVAVLLVPFLTSLPSITWTSPQPMPILGWGLWIIMIACAFGTLHLYRQRFLAVIVLSGVGLCVSLTFVFLSAPDLALTQLLVELVTLALILLALNYLPQTSPPEPSRLRRWRDIAIAGIAGTGIAVVAYQVMTSSTDTIAGELLMRSLPEAHGRNVVNVILVDFRGFDTFGEITVFGIAGLIIHAMLRRTRMAPDKIMAGPPARLTVPATLAQILFPLTMAISVFLFLRGHNAPGGGFIAGLVLAVPLLMQYVLQGTASIQSRFGFDYTRCISIGLCLAALAGLISIMLGQPFLTSNFFTLTLPIIGDLPLSTTLVFDTGVYLVVFGATMLMLSMLGNIKPSLTRVAHHGEIDRSQRSPRTGEMY